MVKREICPIGYHLVANSLFTEDDSEQFLAFIVLKHFYPNMTYWSQDGYTVSAFADYTKDLVWRDSELIEWSTKNVLNPMPDFHSVGRAEAVQIWVNACGDKPENLLKSYIGEHYV